jgi:hypothetical protein
MWPVNIKIDLEKIERSLNYDIIFLLQTHNLFFILFILFIYYLCAVPTAAKPITDTAQCRYRYLHTYCRNKQTNKQTNIQTKMLGNDNRKQ